jgi:dipeptidyl aminopeptidase/acylaminoacyl peptidase
MTQRALLRLTQAALFTAFSFAGTHAFPADPLSVDTFFRHPEIRMASLSPKGNYLALIHRIQGGHYGLVVLPTDHPQDAQIVQTSSETDILTVQWLNENRLIYSVGDLNAQGVLERLNGAVFAANRDASETRLVALPPPKRSYLMRVLDDGSDDVILGSVDWNVADGSVRAITPYRVNTKTGRATSMVEPGLPALPRAWVFDQSGEPRVFTARDEHGVTIYYRAADGNTWQALAHFDPFGSRGAIAPRFIGYDGTLYVLARPIGGTASLYRYDLEHHKLEDQPVFQLDGFDYGGDAELDPDQKKILGYHYVTDATGSAWLDPRLKNIQAQIDKALPDTVNRIACGECVASKKLLVRAVSDRQPARYYLFDKDSGQLVLIGDSLPGITPAQMGRRDFATFKARDGMQIPVYVTTPPGKSDRPFPTVVLVHGGPWVRDASWEWSSIPQFLASRGYLVIEPQFRGTVGYGWGLFRAGWKQWGLAMQDDLSDAARWAIESQHADPKRIAIAGASYGGYATLMGLIKDPELFRCGFEWVGVTDIRLMYSQSWNDLSLEALETSMPIMIGDPVKDAAQLAATSPLANADKLTQPLLMAYGGNDRRVPLEQGRIFLSAVQKNDKDVEWIVYPDEGHGWMMEQHDIDFWSHVERFLEVHLKAVPAS